MPAINGCPYCNGYKPEHLNECSGCWEVRHRLASFIASSGVNQQFVRDALETADLQHVKRAEPETL